MRRCVVIVVVGVTALLAAGCFAVPPPPGTPNGCGKAAPPTVRAERAILSGGVIRTYLLTVPPGYEPDVPAALVLNLHGSGSNAIQQALYTDMDARAAAGGFVVVTPNGIGGRWDFSAPSTDFQFATDLVRYLDSTLCLDPDRRFSTGMSAGGAMSSALACQPAVGLDAIATVTAMLPACGSGAPIPTMSFHGTADPIVSYAPVEAIVGSWAARNGCTGSEDTRIEPDIRRRAYSGCAPGLSTTLYTVEGGGHTWPDGLVDLPAFGPTTRTIDATDLILELFASI
jgi:polyhydroxybutyrate depolymerase